MSSAPPTESMVVKLENLNRLLVVAGDVIINASNLEHAYKIMVQSRETAERGLSEEVLNLTRELSQSALRNGARLHHLVQAIRTVSLKDLTFRGQRTVRETMRKTGKRVRFEVDGESLSLDKTIVEALYDPISHQLRNAVAHGIESPEVRARLQKPEEGVVRLKAYKNETDAFIQISDDGAGFDLDRLRQQAIAAKFHPANEPFTVEDALAFVCQPGISTANTVTESSGRGVGMDVVRERLDNLSGQLTLETEKGRGSTFTYRIPLISAVNIIDALVVECGHHFFAFPIINVVATLAVSASQIITSMKKHRSLDYLGSLLPVVDVLDILDPQSTFQREALEKRNILIIENKGERIAFEVDAFHEPQKLVAVPFDGSLYVRGLSGSTFLGGQRLGFIVDVPALLGRALGRADLKERAATRPQGSTTPGPAVKQDETALPPGSEELSETTSIMAFVVEAETLLAQLGETLFAIEAEPSEEGINRAFRFFHTIKGNLIMMRQRHCAETVHAVETVLNLVRDRKRDLTEEVMDIMMDAVSFIDGALNAIKQGTWQDQVHVGILEASTKLLPVRDPARVRDVTDEEFEPTHEAAYRLAAYRRRGAPLFECSIHFEKGNEPAFLRGCLIYKRLCEVGDVLAALPPLEEMERGLMDNQLRFLFATERECDQLGSQLEQLLKTHYHVHAFDLKRAR